MKNFKEVDSELDKIATKVVDAAFKVHFNLGPGLLENAYETCLAYEIKEKDLKVQRQVEMPLAYEKVRLDVGYRIDLAGSSGPGDYLPTAFRKSAWISHQFQCTH